jgi:hypothetical protein
MKAAGFGDDEGGAKEREKESRRDRENDDGFIHFSAIGSCHDGHPCDGSARIASGTLPGGKS